VSLAEDWERCSPWLAAALAHAGGTHRLDDVRGMVLDGEAQFWAGRDCALVALVEDDPCERRLLIWLAGGARGEIETEILPRAEGWGRARGCRRALIIGRAGWERSLKNKGYAPLARLIAKDL
jgi:hypothetical protein